MKSVANILRVLVLILSVPCMASAQTNDSLPHYGKITSSIGVDVRPSFAFSSYKDDVLRECLNLDKAKASHTALSFHLKYGFRFSPESKQGRIFPEARQGIGMGINMFGNSKGLGNPVSIYLFQGAPVYHFNRRLSLYYEWNFGLSAGWKPCDGETAHSNLIVGSSVNAYINLGAGISWKLNRYLSMVAGIDLTHFSNGNTHFPNPGVNMAGLKIGLIHTFGGNVAQIPETSLPNSSVSKRRKISFDFTLYCSYRRRVYRGGERPLLLNGRFGVIGFDFAPMWNVTKNFRTGLSADFQWDESTDLRRHYVSGSTADDITFYRPPFINQVGVGVSARAELVMPIFSVNIGMGYNFIGPEETRATTYQLANLKINLLKGLYLNIGYQLQNFQKQSNLMLGLGYTLK